MSRDPEFETLSVNLPTELTQRVRSLGFKYYLSNSSIVEQALLAFLGNLTEDEIADRLRALGATLRRR